MGYVMHTLIDTLQDKCDDVFMVSSSVDPMQWMKMGRTRHGIEVTKNGSTVLTPEIVDLMIDWLADGQPNGKDGE